MGTETAGHDGGEGGEAGNGSESHIVQIEEFVRKKNVRVFFPNYIQ